MALKVYNTSLLFLQYNKREREKDVCIIFCHKGTYTNALVYNKDLNFLKTSWYFPVRLKNL